VTSSHTYMLSLPCLRVDYQSGQANDTHIASAQWMLPVLFDQWPCVTVWLTTGVPQQLTEQWPPIALPGGAALPGGRSFALLIDQPSWPSRSSQSARDCVWSSHFGVNARRASLQPPLTATEWPVWPLNQEWPVFPSLCLPLTDQPSDHCLVCGPSFRQV